MDRFQLEDSDTLFLRALDGALNGNSLLTTRSLQDLTHRQLAPPIPPKPQHMLKARSVSALNHRGVVRGYNNFDFPREAAENGSPDSTIPPPVPVRSKSRDHFYHTLECNTNTDSGLELSSPQHSQHSRQSSSLDSIREQEEPQPEQLFDDPRYVAVQVEGEGEEEEPRNMDGGEDREEELRRGKDKWSSTPSLTSARLASIQGPATDSRSLRLTHVVGTEIYN